MAETRQINGVVEQFNADELATLRQGQFVERCPVVVRHVELALRGVGVGFERPVGGADRKRKTCPEAVGRTHQVAEV